MARRQASLDARNASAGQARDVPLQRSATSQAPFDARQTTSRALTTSAGQRPPVHTSSGSQPPALARQRRPLTQPSHAVMSSGHTTDTVCARSRRAAFVSKRVDNSAPIDSTAVADFSGVAARHWRAAHSAGRRRTIGRTRNAAVALLGGVAEIGRGATRRADRLTRIGARRRRAAAIVGNLCAHKAV